MASIDLDVTVCTDDKNARPCQASGNMKQLVQGRLVCPVKILEQEKQGLNCGCAAEEGRDRLHEPPALGVGVFGLTRLEVQLLLYLGHDAGDVGRYAAEFSAQVIRLAFEDVGPYSLDKRDKGMPAGHVLVAMPKQDLASLSGDVRSEMFAEGTFADAGLADDHCEATLSTHGVRESGLKLFQLSLPAHEGGVEPRSPGWDRPLFQRR